MTLTVEKFSWRAAIQLTLPKEHGSWSLALEPVAFGLLVAPSAAGGTLAVAALAGFFLRRPLKILLCELDCERWKIARASVFVLTIFAAVGLLLAVRLGRVENFWPLIPAALAGLVFVWADSRNEAREGTAEIAGAVTFGILPAVFAALAGWSVNQSLALAAMSLNRSVPTVLTVRTRLRMAKQQKVSVLPAIMAVLVGTGLMTWFAVQHLAPWLAPAFAVVFVVRTFWLLLWRPQITARQIGITEAVLGGLMLLVLAMTWKSAGGW